MIMNGKEVIWIINQYASSPNAGMGGRHYYFARQLAKKGYEVYLIASSTHHLLRHKPVLKGFFKQENIEDFHFVWLDGVHYDQAHSKKRILNWLVFTWNLLKLKRLKELKAPNTILCSSPSLISFLAARKLAKFFNSRLVFEVRDIWPLSLIEIGGFSLKHPFIRFLQWIEDKAYRESDAVVSNLKNSLDHMNSRGLKSEKFYWIPNGFSLDEVEKKKEVNEESKQLIPKNTFTVGYAGTHGVANSLETLIKAAEKLRDYQDISFVLVGAGKEKERLKDLAEKKQLKNVFFLNPVSKVEVYSLIELFDVCYLGLTKDDLFRFGVSPNKLFDYLISARPVIYAIESGEYRPVEEARAGIQIPPEDEEKLKEAILTLYQMPLEKREELGRNGKKEALENYEFKKLTDQLESVLFKRD